MCYSKPACTGDIVEAPGPTVRDCCVGTNDGQSYEDGECKVSQCVGELSSHFDSCIFHE